MRLLLVEDEKKLADALEYILKKNKYGVDVAYDGETGQMLAESDVYDLIVLDRMLPGKEGVELLKELRQAGIHTPVLLLTARDSLEDRVEGLDAGADDYLVKPFATEELLARIRAMGRRPSTSWQNHRLEMCGLSFDPDRAEVSNENRTIKLTVKESLLLELLMRNAGQVITKEQILDRVWGLEADVEISSVEIYVHYLRKKLPPHSIHIETVRGIGYCLKERNDVP